MIYYKDSVKEDLKKIGKVPLLAKLEQVLGKDPKAEKVLTGELQGLFVVRIGDYRVIYTKTAEGVLVLRIAHRKEVYR